MARDLGGLGDLVPDQGGQWSLGAGTVCNTRMDKRPSQNGNPGLLTLTTNVGFWTGLPWGGSSCALGIACFAALLWFPHL